MAETRPKHGDRGRLTTFLLENRWTQASSAANTPRTVSVDTRYVPSYRGFTPDVSRMSSAFKGQHARHGMRALAFLAFLTGLQRAICTCTSPY